VESWFDDLEDNVLTLLMPFLEQIVVQEVPDVRVFLSPENKIKIQRCLEGNQALPLLHEFDR
jgi:TFIIF-interacting CTD phosphatase-like protein